MPSVKPCAGASRQGKLAWMRKIRLHCAQKLAADTLAALDEDQARHLVGVLRLGEGDAVSLFNAADGEWRGTLTAMGKRAFGVRLQAQAREPSPAATGPRLVFAPVKRQATDWIIEKATELGAARLSPVLTRRTIAETVRLDRWQAIARDAAAQSERLDLPTIDPPAPLDQVLAHWSEDQILLFADEAGGAPVWSALAGLEPSGAAPALLVGPEGGFDPIERSWLQGLRFVRSVSLGPLILRAETACVAGLSVIQAWQAGRGA